MPSRSIKKPTNIELICRVRNGLTGIRRVFVKNTRKSLASQARIALSYFKR